MNAPLNIEVRDGVAVLRMDHPPVNALCAALRAALHEALLVLREDPDVRGVVIAGAGRAFSAGADVAEFQAAPQAYAEGRDPAEIGALIECYGKPVVAALHGFAFGGGLVLALACHARVAAQGTKLGLPEVSLGLLPGAGGTQRLPRLVGVEIALNMMLGGHPLEASAALDAGLVDALVDGDVVQAASDLLWQRLWLGGPPRVTGTLVAPDAGAAPALLAAARALAGIPPARRAAAARIVDCVQVAVERPLAEGLRFERAAFVDCLRSPDAAALQHAFMAERAAGRALPGAAARPVATVGVLGGGTMGRGIAMAAAAAGLEVLLMDTDEPRSRAAVAAIANEHAAQAARGRMTAADATDRSARVHAVAGSYALVVCDLVIEAVFEDLEVKLRAAEMLGRHCRVGAVIASNTSTLDIDRLAQASGRPADFLGLHFFSPAHVMRLVEVIRGAATSPEALATALALARALRKQPVVCGVGWGFIGNRMLEPYLREAESLLLEGATPARVDRVLESFGMAMGPCRMMDLAGLDVVAKVVQARAAAGTLPPDPRYRIVARHLAELGRHGQKNGEGCYRYDGRRALDDHDAVSLIASLARRHGVPQRDDMTDDEILQRCLLPLIDEGHRVLAEGVAGRASDIDVVWLAGYGFPERTGGPMFHGTRLGAITLVRQMQALGDQLGNPWGYWTPSAALLAAAGTTVEKTA